MRLHRAAASTIVALASAAGAVAIVEPIPPINPTERAHCDTFEEQWKAIRSEIDKMHSRCLDDHKNCKAQLGGACTCGACEELHNPGRLGKEKIAECREAVRKHQEEKRKAEEAERERRAKMAGGQRGSGTTSGPQRKPPRQRYSAAKQKEINQEGLIRRTQERNDTLAGLGQRQQQADKELANAESERGAAARGTQGSIGLLGGAPELRNVIPNPDGDQLAGAFDFTGVGPCPDVKLEGAKLDGYPELVLKDLLATAGLRDAVVTSEQRSFQRQAELMLSEAEAADREGKHRPRYDIQAREVMQLRDEFLDGAHTNREDYVARMVSKIDELVSHYGDERRTMQHLADGRNRAFDVKPPEDDARASAFRRAIESDRRVIRCIFPKEFGEHAFHIEVSRTGELRPPGQSCHVY
jgi:hypothetical protein